MTSRAGEHPSRRGVDAPGDSAAEVALPGPGWLFDNVLRLGPRAFTLAAVLHREAQSQRRGNHVAATISGLAATLGWDRHTVGDGIRILEEAGYLTRISAPDRAGGGPALYRLTRPASMSDGDRGKVVASDELRRRAQVLARSLSSRRP